MQRSYDAVVIGGGVMGLMTAVHLRLLGAGSVVLLERRFLGAGESGKSGAILRQHYSHVQTIRMAGASLQEFASFQERTGRDIGFRRLGMLIVLPESDRPILEANIQLQKLGGCRSSFSMPTDCASWSRGGASKTWSLPGSRKRRASTRYARSARSAPKRFGSVSTYSSAAR